MKRMILLGICTFFAALFCVSASASVFPINTGAGSSCGLVNSYTDAQFCSEFKTVTLCYCDAQFPSKLWPAFCPSVSKIYSEAMGTYGSLQAVCQHAVNNHQSSGMTECENQWSCAMTGKTFSGGACPANPGGNQPCPNI